MSVPPSGDCIGCQPWAMSKMARREETNPALCPSARPNPSGPRWRIARAILRRAISSTGRAPSGRTMPAMPHTSVGLCADRDRRGVQVGRRVPHALDLRVGGLDALAVDVRQRRELVCGDVVLLAPDEQVHAVVRVAEVELLLRLRDGE